MRFSIRGAHAVQVIRLLGNEDQIRARRHPPEDGNPAGVPPHHLDDHDTLVALGGRVKPVDRRAHHAHSRVEAERVVCAAQIVVDRLGQADHGHAAVVQLGRGCERPVPSRDDEGVEAIALDVVAKPVEVAGIRQRIDARRAEDGAPLGKDAVDGAAGERLHVELEKSRANRAGFPGPRCLRGRRARPRPESRRSDRGSHLRPSVDPLASARAVRVAGF